MMLSDEAQHDETACRALFTQFFKSPERIVAELASEGWENSPLLKIFHPTPEQRYEEALRIHKNLNDLLRGRGRSPEDKDPPKLADYLDQEEDQEIQPLEEIVKIVGRCLWDIFSDNHEVISHDGLVYDLGSFRGSAGFLADYINRYLPVEHARYDYMDFYLGTIFVEGRADVTPVYEWIFKNLKEQGCDWVYHFPRLYALDLGEIREELRVEEGGTLERQKRRDEVAEFQKKLHDMYEEAVEEAKSNPLPKTVQAYKSIYGALPKGWPHR